MKRISEIVGMQVVNASTGEFLGKVADLLLDTQRARLAGLVVSSGRPAGERMLPFDDVQRLGAAVVVAGDAPELLGAREWSERRPPATRSSTLKGKAVMTAAGRRVGTVTDLMLDERTGAVDCLEVGHGDGAILTRWSTVPAGPDVRIREDAVVCPAPPRRRSSAPTSPVARVTAAAAAPAPVPGRAGVGPMMVQGQIADSIGHFRQVLACGSADDMIPLLEQAGPAIGGPDAGLLVLEHPVSPRSRTQAVRRALDLLEHRGVRIIREQPPTLDAASVIERVGRDGHDLVLKAVARSPQGKGMALDRIGRQLIDTCPCPVWLGNREAARPPERIVAVVDPSRDDEVARRLSHQVLAAASMLAAHSSAELHILHTWIPFGAHLLRSRVPPAELREYVDEANRWAQESLNELMESVPLNVPLAPNGTHVLGGEMERELARLMATRDIDTIVIGTRGRRTRLSSALMAPRVRQVLGRAVCSALVLKP